MAEAGSINNSTNIVRPDLSGSQESLTDSVSSGSNAREVHFAQLSSNGRSRATTSVQPSPEQRGITESFRRARSQSIESDVGSPGPSRRVRFTEPSRANPVRSQQTRPANLSELSSIGPKAVEISVASIRASFGGLIERTAGGAQTVSEGYDKTIRAHFDNIRETVSAPGFSGDKKAVTEYLDYLESLLPPRPSTDKPNTQDILPNSKTVSADNRDNWLELAPEVTALKTDWAIIAGQIGSLQNAADRDAAVAQIRSHLAHTETRLNFLPDARSDEIRDAVAGLEAYQQYLYDELAKKLGAIESWERAAGTEVVAAFQVATNAIELLPGKPEERRQALADIRTALAAIPEAQQNTESGKFIKAQLRFFEREARIIDIWKASEGHTDRTRTKAEFLKARLFLHQNTYAYADRITARNSHITALLDSYPALNHFERSKVTQEIRNLLLLNKFDYDSAVSNLPTELGLKKQPVQAIFADFNSEQAQLNKGLKQAESAPQAPPNTTPKLTTPPNNA